MLIMHVCYSTFISKFWQAIVRFYKKNNRRCYWLIEKPMRCIKFGKVNANITIYYIDQSVPILYHIHKISNRESALGD